MNIGIVSLIIAYGLSQFFRMFLSVLSPDLALDIGTTGADLAQATSLWFLAFGVMQIPIGTWLDRFGPRKTVAGLMALGGLGAVLVSVAQEVWHIKLAMALIGAGCAPVMISAYYIYARMFPPAAFAGLAGMTIGFGGLGNVAGTAPLAFAVTLWGWRGTMLALAGLTIVLALVVLALLKDPPRTAHANTGTLREALRLRPIWPVMAMLVVGYGPAAGLSGGWGGPYLSDTFGADAQAIGRILLVMSGAIILGSFAAGPLERMAGSPRNVVLAMTGGSICGLVALWQAGSAPVWIVTALLAVVGFCGSSFPLLMAHGKSFIPPALTARAMTLMNLCSIGGAGLVQMLSAQVWSLADQAGAWPYGALFLFFAASQIIGLAFYLTSAAPRGVANPAA